MPPKCEVCGEYFTSSRGYCYCGLTFAGKPAEFDPDTVSHELLPDLGQFTAKDEVLSDRQKARAAGLSQYRAACQIALRPVIEELRELRQMKAEIQRLVG